MRLWEDGFDHYGTAAHLTNGAYASSSGATITNAHPATGGNGVLIDSDNFNGDTLRKVVPVALTKMGAASRIYFTALPSGYSGGPAIFDFYTSDSHRAQVSCVVGSSGEFRFLRGRSYQTINGENGTLIASSNPAIVANANNHIEVQVFIDPAAGWVRAAVNGEHVFQATGLNTQADASKINSVGWAKGPSGSANQRDFYLDDLFLYDFNGNPAIDTDFCCTVDGTGLATNYIGELQVWPLFTNGDTAQADWAKSSGVTGYNLINDVPPDDTSFISANGVGNLSEFDLDDLPPQITYIRGLGIHSRMSKSDAGAAMYKSGMKSVAAVTDTAEIPVTTAPTYWRSTVDIDPNSGGRWTRASLNAAKLRLTRSV